MTPTPTPTPIPPALFGDELDKITQIIQTAQTASSQATVAGDFFIFGLVCLVLAVAVVVVAVSRRNRKSDKERQDDTTMTLAKLMSRQQDQIDTFAQTFAQQIELSRKAAESGQAQYAEAITIQTDVSNAVLDVQREQNELIEAVHGSVLATATAAQTVAIDVNTLKNDGSIPLRNLIASQNTLTEAAERMEQDLREIKAYLQDIPELVAKLKDDSPFMMTLNGTRADVALLLSRVKSDVVVEEKKKGDSQKLPPVPAPAITPEAASS